MALSESSLPILPHELPLWLKLRLQRHPPFAKATAMPPLTKHSLRIDHTRRRRSTTSRGRQARSPTRWAAHQGAITIHWGASLAKLQAPLTRARSPDGPSSELTRIHIRQPHCSGPHIPSADRAALQRIRHTLQGRRRAKDSTSIATAVNRCGFALRGRASLSQSPGLKAGRCGRRRAMRTLTTRRPQTASSDGVLR